MEVDEKMDGVVNEKFIRSGTDCLTCNESSSDC